MQDDHVTGGDVERRVADLFAHVVPEIAAGTVTIQAVARKPGVRTKIAVASADPVIDAVEACVGPGAQRVRAVVSALDGERIDIVPWAVAPERRIRYALAPLPVLRIELETALLRARVWAREEDVAKFGQEHRELASRLSGWDLQLEVSPPAA